MILDNLGGGLRVGDQVHDQLVKDIANQEEHYRNVLQVPFQQAVEGWRLYLGSRKKDDRKPHEKWRAFVRLPYPYSLAETLTAALCDLMDSADPQVQPDPVFEADERVGRPISRLLDYTFRANRWPTRRELLFREMAIQGTAFAKVTWSKSVRTIRREVTLDEVRLFRERLEQAEQVAQLQAPTDSAEAFEEWRRMVNAGIPGGPKVPPLPVAGDRVVWQYEGPKVDRVSLWNLRFDPQIESMDDQRCVIHRMVWPQQRVEELARAGYFVASQVAAAGQAGDDERWSQWQQAQASLLGIQSGFYDQDPIFHRAAEIWECWLPGTEFPYVVLMNGKAIINPDPTTPPNISGKLPFFPLRHVALPGYMLGTSALQQSRELFYEADALRSLRLDAVTLAVLPVFMKLRDSGMSEVQRFFRPGSVIDVPRLDAIAQLIKDNPSIAHAFREIAEIKNDVDETEATFAQVRGATSSVGRVSATESQQRVAAAMQRTKTRVLRLEDEASAMVEEMLALWYQHGQAQIRIAAAGEDPLVMVDRESLPAALQMNFRFRGASKALNRDLAGQQLMAFWKSFGSLLSPVGAVNLAKRVYETLGQKGADEILGDALEFIQSRMQAQAQPTGQEPPPPDQGQPPEPPPEQGGEQAAA